MSEDRDIPLSHKLLWAVLVAVLAVVGTVFVWRMAARAEPRACLKVYGEMPEFTLTDQAGRPFARRDLEGHVAVVNFIFSYCSGPCPKMTRRMKALAETFRDRPEVRLLSITADPERDTPEVLADYARGFSIRDERWFFLTGDRAAIRRISVDGLRLGMGTDGHQGLAHSTRFILLDRRGRVRGHYAAIGEEDYRKLTRALRALLEEKG